MRTEPPVLVAFGPHRLYIELIRDQANEWVYPGSGGQVDGRFQLAGRDTIKARDEA